MIAGLTMLAAATHEAAHEAAQSGLPQLNTGTYSPQLFWLVLTFLALWFVMSKIALPRVGEVISERRDRIQRDIDAAGRLKADTDKALADYEKALADARSNASSIAKDTRQKLASETDGERAKVEAQLASKLADAEARILATKTKSLASVNDIAADTATAVVNRLIGHEVSAEEIKAALAAVTK